MSDRGCTQRDPECVKRWPDCEVGEYNPACCRWPKSCSCWPSVPYAYDRYRRQALGDAWTPLIPGRESLFTEGEAHV